MPTLTSLDAAHLLRRVGFGGSRVEIDALTGLERTVAVDRVMDVRASPSAAAPFGIDQDSQYAAGTLATDWWVRRMATSPAPLVESMTLFWHGHFATRQSKVNDMVLMFDQHLTIRALALGDFGSLCNAVAVNPAMLIFLDNAANVRTGPQENFARELMELFTIGTGNYTEADVGSMAKAWTGHGLSERTMDVRPTYQFRPDMHDDSVYSLFGISRSWNGPESIDEIVRGSKAQACARFVTNKLFAWFVGTQGAATTLEALARTFQTSGMRIDALARAILLTDEFWLARNALVKSPIDLVVDVLRRTGLRVEDSGIHWALPPMGQTLFDPPNVKGWGANEYWLTTSSIFGRGSWLRWVGWELAAKGHWAGLEKESPANGVARILSDLGMDQCSAATRTVLTSWFADTQQSKPWSIPANAFVVATMAPEFHVK